MLGKIVGRKIKLNVYFRFFFFFNKIIVYKQLFEKGENIAHESSDKSLQTLAKISTKIVDVNNENIPNLIDFLLQIIPEIKFSETEEISSKSIEKVRSVDFDDILKKDLEINLNSKGTILNFKDFNENQQHLYLINKSLYYASFKKLYEKNDIYEIYEVKY